MMCSFVFLTILTGCTYVLLVNGSDLISRNDVVVRVVNGDSTINVTSNSDLLSSVTDNNLKTGIPIDLPSSQLIFGFFFRDTWTVSVL